jgi:uncharacterized tellurite resistance protein B-like protein
MLDAIKRLLTGQTGQTGPPPAGAQPESDEEQLRIAACVLLLELAHADDEFSPEERRHIEGTLARHFDLSPEATHELMILAEERRKKAVDLHEFTSLLGSRYDEGQRLLLAEIMWRIVYADGALSRHEDYLMTKVARLLDLRPGYLAMARKRAAPEHPA